MPRFTIAALLLAAAFCLPAPAGAQVPTTPQPLPPEPIGLFVVDARGVMARFKQDPNIAAGLGVPDATDLPARGFGLTVGAHIYPLRGRRVALGVGGEILLRARGSRTKEPATEDGPEGPTVITTMNGFSPQVSLNFGKRDGYSYVSAGLGPVSVTSEIETAPVGDAETRPKAINYGGGARWFTSDHLAFSFDLRFYAIRPQEPTAQRPAFPRMTVMVVSAGISVR